MSCGFDDGTQMTLSGRMNADFFYFFVVQYSIVILNAVKNLKALVYVYRSFANAQDDKERGSTQTTKGERSENLRSSAPSVSSACYW